MTTLGPMQKVLKDILDQMSDTVLAYRPKIKTKAAKRRARRNKRAANVKVNPKSRE